MYLMKMEILACDFLFRSAYKLAGSFNFRGRLRQLFYVLTDDRVGSGPRPAPHSLQFPGQPDSRNDQPSTAATDHDHDYDMEVLGSGSQSVKRKAADSETAATKRR
jgi:hypothetical protein